VQRSNTDPACFSVLKCGTLLDRFSQIDMLHLDVWWLGLNVLVDGGSYLYNGPSEWHNHFMRTESHNTVAVDGRDQMLHFRPFKCLYRARATLLTSQDTADWSVRSGEHEGYRRHPGQVVHRRSVLHAKEDLWVVVDTLRGKGDHEARLHWLAGDFPFDSIEGGLALRTPAGAFTVKSFDERAHPLEVDVARGQDNPPRGWLSRYYGEKVAVPSLAVRQRGALPMVFVSVLGSGSWTVARERNRWLIESDKQTVTFGIRQGLFTQIRVQETDTA
jgi:asparagine synthase (glutamine-hydrolysing)